MMLLSACNIHVKMHFPLCVCEYEKELEMTVNTLVDLGLPSSDS